MKKEQVTEWTENPVTIELVKLAKKELKEIMVPSSDCLIPGEPFKTFENIIELEARQRVWTDWIAFLEGDWEYFEDE